MIPESTARAALGARKPRASGDDPTEETYPVRAGE